LAKIYAQYRRGMAKKQEILCEFSVLGPLCVMGRAKCGIAEAPSGFTTRD